MDFNLCFLPSTPIAAVDFPLLAINSRPLNQLLVMLKFRVLTTKEQIGGLHYFLNNR